MIIQHEGKWYLECPLEEARYARVGEAWFEFDRYLNWSLHSGGFVPHRVMLTMQATFFKLLPMPGEGEWDVFYGRDAGDRKQASDVSFWHEGRWNKYRRCCEYQCNWEDDFLYALPKPVQPEVPEGWERCTREEALARKRGESLQYCEKWGWNADGAKNCPHCTDHYCQLPLPSQPPVGESIEFHLPDDLYQVERFLTAAKFFLWTGVVRVEASNDQQPEAMPSTQPSGCRNCGCPDCRGVQEEPETGSTEGSTKNEFTKTCGVEKVQRWNLGYDEVSAVIFLPGYIEWGTEILWCIRGKPWPTEVEAPGLWLDIQLRDKLGIKAGDKVYIRRAP